MFAFRRFVLGSVLLVLATSCGGGEEGITKETFVAQANAICAAANERERGTGVTVVGEGPGWQEFVAVGEAALADLRALPRPDGDEEQIGEMLRLFDSAYATAITNPASAESDILEAWRIAREYGLDECTGLGYVPPSVQ